MFAESLLETSWAQRTRRGWTALTSFALESLIIVVLLVLPLWRTIGLPTNRALPTPISWGAPPPAAPPSHRQNTTTVVRSNLADNILIAPHEIPRHIAHVAEAVAPPQIRLDIGVPGGTGDASATGVWRAIADSLNHVAPVPLPTPKPVVREFRTSRMLEGSLIRRVQPTYPPLAKTAGIQGQVVLAAVISKAGMIENLRTLSGHPLLVPAAVQAVSQWRYRPYVLNGEAIEVETQISVNFILARN